MHGWINEYAEKHLRKKRDFLMDRWTCQRKVASGAWGCWFLKLIIGFATNQSHPLVFIKRGHLFNRKANRKEGTAASWGLSYFLRQFSCSRLACLPSVRKLYINICSSGCFHHTPSSPPSACCHNPDRRKYAFSTYMFLTGCIAGKDNENASYRLAAMLKNN